MNTVLLFIFVLIVISLATHEELRIFFEFAASIRVILQKLPEMRTLLKICRIVNQIWVLGQIIPHVFVLIEIIIPVPKFALGNVILRSAWVLAALVRFFSLHES